MISLGLDMSSTKSGYGLFKDDKLIDYGVWAIPKDIVDWRDRAFWMGDRLKEFIKKVEEAVGRKENNK